MKQIGSNDGCRSGAQLGFNTLKYLRECFLPFSVNMLNSVGSCSSLRRSRRTKKRIELSLLDKSVIPDDIIVEILSRLPAKDVLRCQCVSKRWKDLTSTRDFIELHSKRCFPMILKICNGQDLLDRCWEPGQTRSKVRQVYKPKGENNCFILSGLGFISSHNNGLLVSCGGMRTSSGLIDQGFIIYNPIYHDRVHINIITTGTAYGNEIYGVFFHPVQKELCTLWRKTLSIKPLKAQYKILNLESNPTWQDIKNPSPQSDSISGAVLIDNKYFYWMIEPYHNFIGRRYGLDNLTFNCDIIEYDIVNEEFRMIPCPVPVDVFDYYYYNVTLVDIGGAISLVQVLQSKELVGINIWTLKNGREKVWTTSNYIVSSDVYSRYAFPKPIAFWNGELVLQSDGRLYVCNLKLGTFRNFAKKYNGAVRFMSHVTSLVSLTNCKSKICMVEKD